MTPYTPPKYYESAFNCPFCGAYADQDWYQAGLFLPPHGGYRGVLENYILGNCRHCHSYTVWVDGNLIYPLSGTAPLPNPDMPDDVVDDYEEARNILSISPRGAAALLRLSIQKLCKHLGEKGANINDDIASLVKKGLPSKLQKALDSVRVVGNNAVHPGQIDISDDADTAHKLFVFINIIVENQITQPKAIEEFYDEKIPEKDKAAIKKRDNNE